MSTRARSTLVLVAVLTVTIGLVACEAETQRAQGTPSGAVAPPAETPVADEDPEAQIRALFDAYRTATRERRGEAAAGLVDSKVIELYERLRRLAVAGSRGESLDAIRSESLGNRLLMAQLLQLLGPYHLDRMTGREIFVFGISEGLLGGSTFAETEMGAITVTGGTLAAAPAIVAGGPRIGADGLEEPPASWRFVRRDAWRIDLTAQMAHAGALLRRDAKARGKTDDEYLEALVSKLSETPKRDPWRVVTTSGGFSVEMPGRPDELEEIVGSMTTRFYVSRSVHDLVYFVGHRVIDEGADLEAELGATVGAISEGAGAELADATRLRHSAGYDGVLASLSLADGRKGSAQVILVGDTLIQLIVIGSPTAPAGDVKRFFASVRLTAG